ncbi:MAG: RRXRR domain-containing protein, partial [Phascolarctobacterium sp.]|nr:RRXRR domain-containing protein [Phascolarctobacterium sp.]
MLVYVLNKNGQPLMPTNRCGKVRRMLKSGLAVVVKRCPFTIRLNYETTNVVQEVVLG